MNVVCDHTRLEKLSINPSLFVFVRQIRRAQTNYMIKYLHHNLCIIKICAETKESLFQDIVHIQAVETGFLCKNKKPEI